jgi:hypothetical protein
MSLQIKIQRIQIWQVCKPCSESSCKYPSVMIGVIENYHHATAVSHKLNVSRHMLIWTIFLVLACGTSCPKIVHTFQLHSVYSMNSFAANHIKDKCLGVLL